MRPAGTAEGLYPWMRPKTSGTWGSRTLIAPERTDASPSSPPPRGEEVPSREDAVVVHGQRAHGGIGARRERRPRGAGPSSDACRGRAAGRVECAACHERTVVLRERRDRRVDSCTERTPRGA